MRRQLKRIIDIIMALMALIVLSPVLLILWVAVRCKLGTPAVFSQERPGLNGKIFTMYKFRSMIDVRNSDGRPLSDEERLTKFGIWLRNTSLDELPELLNILKGDMSLVGPRPLLPQYMDRYTALQARRHEVLPGLTGLAQINGRNLISWEERFEMDIQYVDNWSLKLDFMIVCGTFKKVLKREGISSRNAATKEEFMGIKEN